MSLRRLYKRIVTDEAIQNIYFVLNTFFVQEDCLVCLEQVGHSENVICRECKQSMHLTCINGWFDTNEMRTCPHCRTNWKFEIDITEVIYVELEDYSEMPKYRNRNRLTVRGSITGPIMVSGRQDI